MSIDHNAGLCGLCVCAWDGAVVGRSDELASGISGRLARVQRLGLVFRCAASRERLEDLKYEVALDRQHLERIGTATPLTGIIELIWNALDADAETVRVEFGRNEIEGIEEIRVIDDGHGMTQQQAIDSFTRLGGSWKQAAPTSQTKQRALHGREGRGRFRVVGFGGRIRWETVATGPEDEAQRLLTRIEIRASEPDHCDIAEAEPTDAPSGTRLLIDQFAEPPTGLGGDGPLDRLTSTFALYLESYLVDLTFAGTRIDPLTLQERRDEYEVEAGDEHAELTVIEWSREMERRHLYLCDESGAPLVEMPAGIQAPGFDFTAYVRWSGFADDPDLVVADLGTGSTKRVLEAARDRLRQHFRERAQERTQEQIARWKEERVYPFPTEPTTTVGRAARDTFDVVALAAAQVVNQAERNARKLSLRLLREALEQDPGSLHRVLRDVLELPQERLDELSHLLDRTPLASIIASSRAITERLEFVRGLEALVLDPDLLKHVKERSQLHRILADETWVFGEEYALAVDDESLTAVLKKHLQILGRTELAEDIDEAVLDLEGHTRIVDLMLARSLKQNRNRREHLVVELKAPSVPVSDNEVAQIRRYAGAVAKDPRFEASDVQWDFIVVSSRVTGTAELERQSSDRPFGQIMNVNGIRAWALTWGEIVDAAQHRLKFVQEHLGCSPNVQQALEYLRRTHSKYLPDAINHSELPAA